MTPSSRLELAVPTPRDAAPAEMTATVMFREHGRYAFRILRRLGVRDADVDDVLQEVFVVVHRRLPDFDGGGSFRAWLYGICIRLAANYRRSHRQRREEPVDENAEIVDQHAATPLEIVEARKKLALLDKLLAELPDQKREVFVLHVIEDLPMHEVAQALGCPLHTAYTRYYAARKLFEAAVRRARAPMSLP